MKSPQQITRQTLGLLRRLGGAPGTANNHRFMRVIRIHNRYMHNILTYYGYGLSDTLSDEEITRALPRHTYGLPRPHSAYSMNILPDEEKI